MELRLEERRRDPARARKRPANVLNHLSSVKVGRLTPYSSGRIYIAIRSPSQLPPYISHGGLCAETPRPNRGLRIRPGLLRRSPCGASRYHKGDGERQYRSTP